MIKIVSVKTLEMMAKNSRIPKFNHLVFILNISLGNNCEKVASFALLDKIGAQMI